MSVYLIYIQQPVINFIHQLNKSMIKSLILLVYLCLLTQQTVIFASNELNTIILSPIGTSVIQELHHNQNTHNSIYNLGARWIWRNGPDAWNDGYQVIFQAKFYADCMAPAKLMITADDEFEATFNGFGTGIVGNKWKTTYQFPLNIVLCGPQTLKIKVTNRYSGTPAALIFAVSQDQSFCYKCKSPLSYYNLQTCKCQCINGCSCKPNYPLMVWYDYPICGCKCKGVSKCPKKQYWNEATCQCKCKPIACPTGFTQSKKTCTCVKNCKWGTNIRCPDGMYWDEYLCKCVCLYMQSCILGYRWDDNSCKCVPDWLWSKGVISAV